MAGASVKVGDRVDVVGKDVQGKVAYIGTTQFSSGKWIGLILDEPKGKNDGSVQGKSYFSCGENYGMFVRQTQIKVLGSTENSPNKRTPLSSRENSGLSARQKSDLAKSAKKGDGTSTPKRQKSDLSRTPESKQEPPMETVAEGMEGGAAELGSKLATPRSRLPLPGSGRQPSFTNITRKGEAASSTPKPEKQPFQRERSFVETNFVQTPRTSNVTQILPTDKLPTPASKVSTGSNSSTASPTLSTVILSDKMEEKVQNIQLQQEIFNYKDEIKDLQEKVETLKVKRAQDKEKLKDYEKLMLQNEQLIEFKTRIMEAQAQLQRDLQKAKHEAREAVEAKERHAEEMADLSETVEMATLDKEMAEEKAETLQLELDAAREKVEELTLDLDIIKAEIGEGGGGGGGGEGGGGVTNFELKTLQAQNEKLRETLVSMRDLSAHEKHELAKLGKELEEKVSELTLKTKDNEKLLRQVEEMEQTIGDLQEQVDAALGAEEMVENLTSKCLDLEDRLTALLEEKSDLEALHDINEEMQENAREVELELREELDLQQTKIREANRDREAAMEIILDHEATIAKFRAFVSQVQEQNHQLKEALEKETSKPVSGSMGVSHEMLDFKKMFAETKAHAKAIDVELRRCELAEATSHVKYLMAYMGEGFTARGGDYEAVQVLLLVPRLIWKADILMGQVRDLFGSPDTLDLNTVLKGHTVDRYVFGTRMLHLLHLFQKSLHQFSHALDTCSVETFLRVGTLYPEMSVHEKGIDFYIDLLHKGQLDENVHVTNLERTVSYFETIYPLHLTEVRTDCGVFMLDHVRLFLTGTENLETEVKRARILLDQKSEGTEVGLLLKSLEGQVKEVEAQVKGIRRRLPQDGSQGPISYPESVASSLSQAATSLSLVIKVLSVFGKSCMSMATANPETALPGPKMHEALHAAVDTTTDFGDRGIEFCSQSLATVVSKLGVISTAIQNGEYDFDGSREQKGEKPVVLRSEAVKAEVREATGLKYKLESKDMDIKEMKKLLKMKQEEVSEMQIRKDLLEKRLNDSSRDNDLMIEKLQRKLDDAHNLLKRKEKEFEETMDHLQADIDSLESERGELKDKMKQMSKKALIQGLTKSHSINEGPSSMGPSVPSPIRDSPLLVQQVQDMRAAVVSLQSNIARVQAKDMKERLAKLKPIKVPQPITVEKCEKRDKGKEEEEANSDIGDLIRRCNTARSQLYNLLSSQQVVDVTRTQGGTRNSNLKALREREVKEAALRSEIAKLQLEASKLIAARQYGGIVPAAFGTFASTGASRALAEKEYSLYGKIQVGGGVGGVEAASKPLILDLEGLKQLHSQVLL